MLKFAKDSDSRKNMKDFCNNVLNFKNTVDIENVM